MDKEDFCSMERAERFTPLSPLQTLQIFLVPSESLNVPRDKEVYWFLISNIFHFYELQMRL